MIFKLLLVDDEKPIRHKLINNTDWEKSGYQVYAAANGEAALALIKEKEINILVTDIQMPKLSGMNLIEEAKKIRPQLKIIIISGYAEFEYAQQSIRFGVNDYLLKPFRSQKLLEVVNTARDQILNKQNQASELALLQKEIADYIDHSQADPFYSWLNDEKFIEEQSLILNQLDLNAVLKRGSKDDILKIVNKIVVKVDQLALNKEKIVLFLNNLILESFKIIKEFDYPIEDLLVLIDKQHLKDIIYADFQKQKLAIFLKEFLLRLHDLLTFKPGEQKQQLIAEMKDYIAQNYQQGITLNQLAVKFNLSTGHLSNLFQEETGESFSDYLNMLRLAKAKELLKTTDNLVYQVADQLGFNDAYYFSSWFKKMVGTSPTTYRENINLF
ncbi:response regulator transcription factor [Halanaerobium salsuginis]|uniref:Stage 0 sporulation protein A homolog n=1 Tax=Halanaerobium salsuginis TaxID=29563 RepID=A0A1I4L229_9FIRM|nr:response regulator [Halanaerobium salsuginis]SFL84936.1 two-component system, response regulator YesN [Halanaerobium salsuginis]